MPEACTWKRDEFDATFDTDCGNKFEFYDGGPEQNGWTHCPYCGKPIIQGPLPIPDNE